MAYWDRKILVSLKVVVDFIIYQMLNVWRVEANLVLKQKRIDDINIDIKVNFDVNFYSKKANQTI